MTGKAREFFLKTKRFPFGIICGSCGMAVFFATIGLVLGYAVTAGIAAQTNKTVSFLENWWQVLLFIVVILAATVAAASLVMYILKKLTLIAEQDDKYFEEVSDEEYARTNVDIDSIKAELAQMTAYNAELRAELARSEERNAALQTELETAKAQNAELLAELEGLRAAQSAKRRKA